jgi:hypothetical protein
MGARVALQSVLGKQSAARSFQHNSVSANSSSSSSSSSGSGSSSSVRWAGAVIISGTPGIPDPDLRAARVAKDRELSDLLLSMGAAGFLGWWYQQPLWGSLRAHPGFRALLAKRAAEQAGQEGELAAALTYSSTGRMVSVRDGGWEVQLCLCGCMHC